MPLITVKVFKDELSRDQSKELITKITNSVAETTSEKLRDVTWVVIEEVNDNQWGVGGKNLSLDDVKALMAS